MFFTNCHRKCDDVFVKVRHSRHKKTYKWRTARNDLSVNVSWHRYANAATLDVARKVNRRDRKFENLSNKLSRKRKYVIFRNRTKIN